MGAAADDAMVGSWGVGESKFHVAAGGGDCGKVSERVFAIWSMWFRKIGFLVALRSIWLTWFSFFDFNHGQTLLEFSRMQYDEFLNSVSTQLLK
jgi:hypothetical protein